MDDDAFSVVQSEIDELIDALPGGVFGIKMGFGLAGAFYIRNLLETKIIDFLVPPWETKMYRGVYVWPEPLLDDFEYVVGRPKDS